jgi:hypothetical protein
LNLKANLETRLSYYILKRSLPGAFDLDFIGSTCTASPAGSGRNERGGGAGGVAAAVQPTHCIAAQVKLKANFQSASSHAAFKR